ncbi:hypothetical protein V6K52_13960 [Knoellia sp. S7-12]|uniref:hypothetical protein n=1 Tax=Knoellia sp. S7-12 TaxID=3126698 RepID=UPI0033697FE6
MRTTNEDGEKRTAELARSKRRSWTFVIGAPYAIAIPLGLWALVYGRLPLWANRTIGGLALTLVAVYLLIALSWTAKNVLADRRAMSRHSTEDHEAGVN